MSYLEEKAQKRLEREQKALMRFMSSAPARGEMIETAGAMQREIVSVALAIEAVETLLIERGILKDNEVMERIQVLAAQKREQENAAPPEGTIIAPV